MTNHQPGSLYDRLMKVGDGAQAVALCREAAGEIELLHLAFRAAAKPQQLRDKFAAAALQGTPLSWRVNDGKLVYDHAPMAAQFAYLIADAMLVERLRGAPGVPERKP